MTWKRRTPKAWLGLLIVLLVGGLLLVSCQPKTVIVRETVEVEKEKIVEETVIVEVEKVVEETVIVEVEKVVKETVVVEVEKVVKETVVVEKEVPQVVETVLIGSSSAEVTLGVMLMAPTGTEQQIWQDQVTRFTEKDPTIAVELQYFPAAEYFEKLAVLLAAGTPPDVTELSYYHVALFQQQDYLQPLDELVDAFDVNTEDFWADALESNTFGDELYALPRQRFACSPRYRNLVLPKAGEHHGEAFLLMDFLTQEEQQVENFERMGGLIGYPRWPTRESVNDLLEEDKCDPFTRQVERLLPEDLGSIWAVVSENRSALENVLGGQTLSGDPAGAVEDGEPIGAAVAAVSEQGEPWIEVSFPDALASEDGVFVGGLFVASGKEIQDQTCTEDSFCAYAVRCRTDESKTTGVTCWLVDPGGGEYQFDDDDVIIESTKGNVGWPFCTLETASPGHACFNLDSRTICVWVPW
jgi:hypothetical protein